VDCEQHRCIPPCWFLNLTGSTYNHLATRRSVVLLYRLASLLHPFQFVLPILPFAKYIHILKTLYLSNCNCAGVYLHPLGHEGKHRSTTSLWFDFSPSSPPTIIEQIFRLCQLKVSIYKELDPIPDDHIWPTPFTNTPILQAPALVNKHHVWCLPSTPS